MRIITGIARGRKLKTLQGDAVRPTAESVKEALFSIIQFDIEGRRVLDLFAGSGQLGLEALSRGAKSVVLVDSSKEAVETIKSNIASTGLTGASAVYSEAYSYLLVNKGEYDIVFLDPPYEKGCFERVLPLVLERLSPYGVAVCERHKHERLPELENVKIKDYHYGITVITFIRKDNKS